MVDYFRVLFSQISLFSLMMFVGTSIGTPNIRTFYKMASLISTELFIAIKSYPNVDASTELYL